MKHFITFNKTAVFCLFGLAVACFVFLTGFHTNPCNNTKESIEDVCALHMSELQATQAAFINNQSDGQVLHEYIQMLGTLANTPCDEHGFYKEELDYLTTQY